MMGDIPGANAAARWGADYFPNVPLVTHEGETVRFFDDLLKDKVVAINFIYTRCPDTCPLETAQLVQVQKILGDRLGQDVFFYSISIDPENDTPEVLGEYRERFKARWTFLTGEKSDIIELRKKLGLYIEEIQDGSNNHNVSMIIGNQATGRWMKRSPFENPHVLADQLGNWLTGWKAPPRGEDYASAPKLRSIPRGEQIFRTRCATCHTVTGKEPAGALGPDLLGVSQRRETPWLLDWLKAPDQMLAKQDPIAMALYAQYNDLAMPNMRLNKQEALALLEYIDAETRRILGESAEASAKTSVTATFPVAEERPAGDVVAVMNAWVREAGAGARVNAGYMTLINVGGDAVTLRKVESEAFERVEVHEMAMVEGLMEMREVTDLSIPARGQIRFEPGGKHLMLMDPRTHLSQGQQVDMTLTFASGRQQTVSVKVAAR
jgi:copper(I)-binding protein/cytochrome oxidase Cu insertion factor (SCO1/SenC/PrrC family)